MDDTADQDKMLQSYYKEIAYFAPMIAGRQVSTIFFGGGTPSLAYPRVIGNIIAYIAKQFNLASDVEITMEANPTSVEADNFKQLATLGINRVSLGIQSLRSDNLKFLGREHSVDEARQAIATAAKHFGKFSIDMIYTLPNQSLDDWLKELDEAQALASGHISLYQLTIEKGTRFYKDFLQQKFTMPEDDLAAQFYSQTTSALRGYGLPDYEVSNYAAPGNECRHNLNYWNYGDYIGIGAGAHGRYTHDGIKYATVMLHDPKSWLAAINEKGIALQESKPLTDYEAYTEKVIMGLRLSSGIDLDPRFNRARIDFLQDHNLIIVDNGKIITTDNGRLVLNSIIKYLLSDEN